MCESCNASDATCSCDFPYHEPVPLCLQMGRTGHDEERFDDGAIVEEPPMQPPHSRFHPVPTRPVFSRPPAVYPTVNQSPAPAASVMQPSQEPEEADLPVEEDAPGLFSSEPTDPLPEAAAEPLDAGPLDDAYDAPIDDAHEAPAETQPAPVVGNNPLRHPSGPNDVVDEPNRFPLPDDQPEMPSTATPLPIESPANDAVRATYHRYHSRLRR